jgi:hypothetical protein
MKRLAYIIPFAAILMVVGCKEDKKTVEPEVVTVETTQNDKVYQSAKGDAAFKDADLASAFDMYIALKTAFVNTNPKVAASAAKRMAAKLEGIEVDTKLTEAVSGIAETEDVEAQRTLFVAVTAAMEDMLEGALESGTIYKQYCPMAFGNTGAYWLSNSKDIYNPYFGDKMLKCGRIDSEIK